MSFNRLKYDNCEIKIGDYLLIDSEIKNNSSGAGTTGCPCP